MAGYINSVALGVFHTPVSHMTGAVSYLGIDLAMGHWSDATTGTIIIAAFLSGSALAGFIIGARELGPGRVYGAALICEGFLLLAAMFLMLGNNRFGVPLVSMACGLQNATTSSYCGLMIRTTHVTGTVTDIGVMLGHWLRHRKIERWRLGFMAAIVSAFGLGVWLGAKANTIYGPVSISVAVAGCIMVGLLICLYPQHRWLRIEHEI